MKYNKGIRLTDERLNGFKLYVAQLRRKILSEVLDEILQSADIQELTDQELERELKKLSKMKKVEVVA